MYTNDFVSIKTIINEVYDDPNINCNVDFIVNKVAELLATIGVPETFEDKEAILHVDRYKAKLPCDLYEVNQVAFTDEYMDIPMIPSTSTFNPAGEHKPTYKIQGGVIVTSFDSGDIKVSYTAFPVDGDGYPMIVNNLALKRAIVSYVVWKWYTIEAAKGTVNLNYVAYLEQIYNNNIGTAITNLRTPTLSQAENISRMINSVLDIQDQHNTFYRHDNDKVTKRF